MIFLVNVPVLSEQIIFAPPMVSQAYNFLTKLLSFIIFFTENASVKVTATGRPSGIETTNTVNANIKILIKF